MREATSSGSTVYYFAADHLGSTSLTMDANGNKIGEMKYMPFGETRYAVSQPQAGRRAGRTWGGTPTDRRFTGQRADTSVNLMFYNARFYSPAGTLPQRGYDRAESE